VIDEHCANPAGKIENHVLPWFYSGAALNPTTTSNEEELKQLLITFMDQRTV
jgi:hypothetical protein